MVFKKTCGGSLCHQASQIAPDLFTAPVENALIGMKAQYGCTDKNFLDASGPVSGSVIMKRITGTDCGDQMPMLAAPLKASDIQCVSDWLASKVK